MGVSPMSQSIVNLQEAQRRGIANKPAIQGFPYLAETLRRAGVHRNEWHLPSMQSVYLTDLGPVVHQAEPLVDGYDEIRPFDPELLVAALRADQAGRSTFVEFATTAWSAGVVRYAVDLRARKCVYFGCNGESFEESYPAVTLPE
ncbi:DUF1398 family protein [Mycolicibacterium sp. CR10]|uniref:DUF1398 family protein n=1 Tax=Mycolicibacterium sp. CR10 TaxID=2562314 RepID=UPI001F0E18A0|nr:DUF1398 family protein [Mycolicibacterium sp. CR10]